ncbi:MAG: threonine synthase [Candidatus Bathyarchaeia archaeon]
MGCMVCRSCGGEYPLWDRVWRCSCGGLLDLEFEAEFPLDKIGVRGPSMWRYREAIPIIHDSDIVSFHEGFTSLLRVGLEDGTVLVKGDHLFPTGSFKDRGASVLISKAKELRVKRVVEDSSGNAGCSIAAYSARAGIPCEVFVPWDASPIKLAQISSYGAKLVRVPGSREDAASAAMEAAGNDYYAGHSWNPFFLHGVKTFAFEVCEQLGWSSPDSVILPVGNGTLLLGAYIGFRDLLEAGVIHEMPRIIGVQSVNCAPLYEAFKKGSARIPEVRAGATIAEGIAVAKPPRGSQVMEAVKASKGEFIAVEDSEIKESLREIAEKGFYIEPTSAAAIAGVKKYLEEEAPDEVIVSTFTGHGLKATDKILEILGEKTKPERNDF